MWTVCTVYTCTCMYTHFCLTKSHAIIDKNQQFNVIDHNAWVWTQLQTFKVEII